MKTKLKDSMSKGERNLINLSIGKKKAKTKEDRNNLEEIENIKKKGGRIYIPHD
jgi:hypothetical protein